MEISGRALAKKIREKIKKDISLLSNKNIFPKIVIITLGGESAWQVFVKQKIKLADKLGIKKEVIAIKHESQTKLLELIEKLNNDKSVNGIIVQRPFSKKINREKVVSSIDPRKDIDGFSSDSKFQAPVTLATEAILKEIFKKYQKNYKNETLPFLLKKKKVVIVGKGETGGGAIKSWLTKLKLTPEIIDSKTKNRTKIMLTADIIISAVGKKDIVKVGMIKKGVILIGIGTHTERDRLKGDYSEEKIQKKSAFYTPTPNGVGPLNIIYLFKNLVTATKLQSKIK